MCLNNKYPATTLFNSSVLNYTLLKINTYFFKCYNCWLTAVSATRWNVELLQWKLVFKSPFWIQKLGKAKIWTEYSYDLMFHSIMFLVA